MASAHNYPALVLIMHTLICLFNDVPESYIMFSDHAHFLLEIHVGTEKGKIKKNRIRINAF